MLMFSPLIKKGRAKVRKLLVLLLVSLMCLPIMAQAETVRLTKGKWIVGQDIAPGHYTMVKASCVASVYADDYQLWIDTKDECVLLDGHTIEILMGAITFVPVTMTTAQASNATYVKLEEYRHQAILTAYEDVCDLFHNLQLGSYVVGVDIPAGSWRVESWGNAFTTITVTSGITKHRFSLACPGFDAYTPGDLTEVYFSLKAGDLVEITNNTGKPNTGIYIYPDNHQVSW